MDHDETRAQIEKHEAKCDARWEKLWPRIEHMEVDLATLRAKQSGILAVASVLAAGLFALAAALLARL